MSSNERRQYSKLSKGDIGYMFSAKQVTPKTVGIVFEIDDARPPHIKLRFPDGTISNYLDYDEVGAGGKPPRPVVSGAKATVHLVPTPANGATPLSGSTQEQQWKIEQVSDEYTYNQGYAYDELGQYERAIQDYDKAIQLDPNDAEAYFNRGYAYGNLGEHQRAIQDYDKAIQLDPNDSMAYYNRGNAYEELGEYQLAIQDNDKAIQLDPNDAGVYHHEGMDFRWVLVQAESPPVKLWLRTGSTFRPTISSTIKLVKIPDEL